ncbi:Zinc finger C2H2 protein [Cucumispora dikerogammari]|nr:Zinc finger C2H2 protein [Cucumispora dikerogammari]
MSKKDLVRTKKSKNVKMVKPITKKRPVLIAIDKGLCVDKKTSENIKNTRIDIDDIKLEMESIPIFKDSPLMIDYLIYAAESEMRRMEQQKINAIKVTKDENLQTKDLLKKGSIIKSTKRTAKNKSILDPDANKKSKELIERVESINFSIVTVKGKKLYVCPEAECSKTFPNMSRIKRHYQIHINIHPFHCNNCKRTFGRKDNMIQHSEKCKS